LAGIQTKLGWRDPRIRKGRAIYYHVRYSSMQVGQILDSGLDSLRQFIEAYPGIF
jgi:hypothetical protein